MRNNRKVIVKLIEDEKVLNHRLLAQYFANKYKEQKGTKNNEL